MHWPKWTLALIFNQMGEFDGVFFLFMSWYDIFLFIYALLDSLAGELLYCPNNDTDHTVYRVKAYKLRPQEDVLTNAITANYRGQTMPILCSAGKYCKCVTNFTLHFVHWYCTLKWNLPTYLGRTYSLHHIMCFKMRYYEYICWKSMTGTLTL